MKTILNVLLSMSLILVGIGLISNGLHAMPVSSMLEQPATALSVSTTGTAMSSAELVAYGSDKDVYNRGDKATGFFTVKNTGNTVIKDVTVSVSVSRSVPLLGSLSLGSKDLTISDLNIKPGETKRSEFSIDIPKEFSGFSTAGTYKINGAVKVDGRSAGSFSKTIKVV